MAPVFVLAFHEGIVVCRSPFVWMTWSSKSNNTERHSVRKCLAYGFDVIQEGNNGRDRDRTDDLYRVKVALVPTELRAQ